MTDVLVRLTAPSSGAAASGWVPADEVAAVGHLECRPWAPDADGARLHLEAPDRLLLPASMPPVRLVAGEAVLHLAATGVGWCWQIIERTPRGKTRYVLVPDLAATLDYGDLVDVDPTTLAPAAEPEAAWWAAIELLSGATVDPEAIAAAVADYLAANPVEGVTVDDVLAEIAAHVGEADPHPQYVTADDLPDVSDVVREGDSRLTDARTPTAHEHTAADVSGLQTALDGKQPAGSYAASAHTHAPADITGTAVITTDPRLSDARTPTAHTHPHTHDDRYYTETEADARFLQPSTAQPVNAQTGTTYTLVAADAGKLVTLTNAAAITLTVPASTFTAGQRVDCLVLGAGMVTVVGSGATVNGTPSLVSRAQYSAFTVLFTSATTAVVVGDLA